MDNLGFTGMINGTETVTYAYGTTFALPEPATLLMLPLGLARP